MANLAKRFVLIPVLFIAMTLVHAQGAGVKPGIVSVYVANCDSNTVSIIDPTNNSVVGTIKVGTCPTGATSNPEGSQVYVTNENDNTVSVIDASTNMVVNTLDAVSRPFAVTFLPNGKQAYLSNTGSNIVSVIDSQRAALSGSITVGFGPAGMTLSPDARFLYVANFFSNSVSAIDTATNTVVATVPVGANPNWVAITPNGATAYVANFGADNVSVIDTASNTVTATIQVGAIPVELAITPDGTRVYVTSRVDSDVSVIDTGSNQVIATIPVGFSPAGVAITSDGQFAYVSNQSSASVSVVGIASNSVVATVLVGVNPFGVTINRRNGVAPKPAVTVVSTINGIATVNQQSGAITHCTAVLDSAGVTPLGKCVKLGTAPLVAGSNLLLASAQSSAFVTNNVTGAVVQCSMVENAQGKPIGKCGQIGTAAHGSAAPAFSMGSTVNGVAIVDQHSGTITHCTAVVGSTGVTPLGQCAKLGSAPFSIGSNFPLASAQTSAFVINSLTGAVVQCSMTENGQGTPIGECSEIGKANGSPSPAFIIGSTVNGVAIVDQQSGAITHCTAVLDSGVKALGQCAQLGTGFLAPGSKLLLASAETSVFVTNTLLGTVVQCSTTESGQGKPIGGCSEIGFAENGGITPGFTMGSTVNGVAIVDQHSGVITHCTAVLDSTGLIPIGQCTQLGVVPLTAGSNFLLASAQISAFVTNSLSGAVMQCSMLESGQGSPIGKCIQIGIAAHASSTPAFTMGSTVNGIVIVDQNKGVITHCTAAVDSTGTTPIGKCAQLGIGPFTSGSTLLLNSAQTSAFITNNMTGAVVQCSMAEDATGNPIGKCK
ncbi:MAG TPA: beta-propeller fold lactonase family protein [Candidatus Angelobacter sp.]